MSPLLLILTLPPLKSESINNPTILAWNMLSSVLLIVPPRLDQELVARQIRHSVPNLESP